MFERPRTGERAVLVRLGLGAPIDPEDLEEFTQLALSAGAQPVATVTGRRDRPDPRYFLGSGKAEELRVVARDTEADLILIDHALSPSQERNLEKLIERRVLDRNGLILDIFAQRARSHEGKLEVELAQLKHIGSRLVRGWTHLERQRGGGVGLRGPGETQLETDRRLISQRVRVLARRLAKIKQQRETGRQMRAEIPVPSLALVGYTNAGKSTLFRALTGEDAYVANQLFATLDPTVRRIQLAGGTQVVVADTVGFIRELPHELVAAFQSTLTEARAATLLLHVVDASNPHREEQLLAVNEVLEEIGASAIPQLLVYNKIDRLEAPPRIDRDPEGRAVAVWISAERGTGIDLLKEVVAERLSRFARPARVRVPASAGALRSRLYAARAVRGESTTDDGSIELAVELPDPELLELARTAGVQILEVQGPGTPCAPASAYLQSNATSRAGKLR
ncbi:MAG: GTPase HflX [Gammaproteobacteria bacterium]|nr:GTPase HflX [Gammaproteobacteria bacterium]MBV8308164.1 GTPase HflX [Gammaproteobacteria bacterium]MBV8404428.1 GTPase HflX [Gammaproteobacteria bacterium]